MENFTLTIINKETTKKLLNNKNKNKKKNLKKCKN